MKRRHLREILWLVRQDLLRDFEARVLGIEGQDELVVLPLRVVVVAEVDLHLAGGLFRSGGRRGSGSWSRRGGRLGGRGCWLGLGGLSSPSGRRHPRPPCGWPPVGP